MRMHPYKSICRLIMQGDQKVSCSYEHAKKFGVYPAAIALPEIQGDAFDF